MAIVYLFLSFCPLALSNDIFRCLNSLDHQNDPTEMSRDALKSCANWEGKACCSEDIAHNISNMGEYFAPYVLFDQCPEKQLLSQKCKDFFIKDTCLYHCGSMFSAWIEQDYKLVRQERYKNIPLCKKDCDDWWEACQDDYTCSRIWYPQYFNHIDGKGSCKKECKKFKEWFSSPKEFCTTIFEGTFNYQENPNKCCIELDPQNGLDSNINCAKRALYIPFERSHFAFLIFLIMACLAITLITFYFYKRDPSWKSDMEIIQYAPVRHSGIKSDF